MTDSPDMLQRVSSLADYAGRADAAAALARAFHAEALLIFADDAEIDAFVPAKGMSQTIVGGPTWRDFLLRCSAPGVHHGEVEYPVVGALKRAVACSGSGALLVLVGNQVSRDGLETLTALLPLLGGVFRCEQVAEVATAASLVARAEARHAGDLARSLDKARAELERQAKALIEAREHAETAARAKDEFLAMLGHELRNPLAPITTALQIMRLRGNKSREQDIVERQVAQLRRLVDDLLDVSRITRGKVDLRRGRVEISRVIQRAIEAASPLLEEKRQELAVEMPSRGLSVDGDADRLVQVFLNLLANASKFSDEETRIEVTAARDGDSVRVRVKDNGVGIEPHLLGSVFEHFVQERQSIERSRGGLGLGLAIAKNLVLLHEGTISAHSDGAGCGAEFTVELPAAVVAADPESIDGLPPESAVPQTDAIDPRVMIVDDNQDAAEMLSLALMAYGYHVEVAADGPSALGVAERFRPRVAILDIGLPVMDGYELGERLRTRLGEGLSLIALTGYGQASDAARSRSAGFQEHLVKPVNLCALRRVLDELLQCAD